MPIDYTITRLSVTPVKGLALHHPDAIDLTMHGAAGDRLFYLVDDTGTLQSCTRNPGLYGLSAAYDRESRRLVVSRGDEVLAEGAAEPAATVDTDMWGLRTLVGDLVADPAWSTFFSDMVSRRVHLVQARGSAFDVQPATLLGTGSVEELARHAGVPRIDSRRFRMLIEFAGGTPHVEDSWDGKRLQIGDANLRAGGPVKRCAATTRHPDSGTVDLQTLRLITAYRGRQKSELGTGANFGIYGAVLEPGKISVGDSLRVCTDA
ncbi:MOSC domain-containing protein [Nocardioides antri]|uniref:MOSC domain-containing protein n=1 Tax=Nocardioides antri TaxID=2607659 RepID=A0A5B1M9L7_9ACTN|nr:MOSC N-terminal beta barrel domain-containing protein [Nocardioides antri]KAA1428659.1 MOSC domain-containing protein [Nocardioides antri]